MSHVSSSRRSSPAPPSHSHILTSATKEQDGCHDLRLWSGLLRHSVFVRWSCDGSRPVRNDTAILHDTSECIWSVHNAVQRDSGQSSRVSPVSVMSMHCAALKLKSCAVRLWVERQWEPLSRKCCNRYGRVLGPNTMLPSWRVRVYLCLYVHMVLCPCMCLLSWQRPAAHSSNIDGCRHVILHISSSYRWKMKCKKAPGITFVSHHIWVCILIYKYFKSVFLGLVWAVNVNVSSCYSFTPLPFYIPFSVTLIMMYCEVMSAVIMNCRKSHWRCSEYSYQCVLIFKYSHWYSREKAQNRARNLWSLKHFPGPETEGLQLVPVWRGAGS